MRHVLNPVPGGYSAGLFLRCSRSWPVAPSPLASGLGNGLPLIVMIGRCLPEAEPAPSIRPLVRECFPVQMPRFGLLVTLEGL